MPIACLTLLNLQCDRASTQDQVKPNQVYLQRMLRDETNLVSAPEALTELSSRDWHNKFKKSSLGFSKDTFWVELKIHADLANSDHILNLKAPRLESVQIYQIINDRPILYQELRIDQSVEVRPIKSHIHAINLTDQTSHYLLRYQSRASAIFLTPDIQNRSEFQSLMQQEFLFYSFFAGFALFAIAYNLFLALGLGRQLFIKYVFYIFFFTLSILIQQNYFAYFVPEYVLVYLKWGVTPCVAFTLLFATVFTREYLTLDIQDKLVLNSLRFWQIVLLCYATLSWIPASTAVGFSLQQIRPVFIVITVFFVSFSAIRVSLMGIRTAQIFLLAWMALLGGAILNSLSTLGLAPHIYLMRKAVVLGSGIEMVLLSIGLIYQVRQLELRNQVAESASKAKSEFLANMSHEIRTPLNAIVGMGEIINQANLSPDNQRYLRILQNATENLLAIVNDVLDVSKIESGELQIEKVSFNLENLVHTASDILAQKAFSKGLDFNCFISPDCPIEVEGDPTRLRQVLINLISNAIKFTEQGEVNIDITPEKNQNDRLRFEIRDTGIGVPENKQTEIFNPFSQADSSITRSHGGTGLGLTISRRLVHLMGGNLVLESKLKKGSAFRFSLDLQPTASINQTRKIPDLSNQKILIVDDNESNRLILEKYLAPTGMQSQHASNGPYALETIEHFQTGFDIYLLDFRMPGMNGAELARRIIELHPEARGRIIILTSEGELISEEAKIGDWQLMIKPIRRRLLYQHLSRLIHDTRDSEPMQLQDNEPLEDQLKDIKILLVEDNPDNQILFQAFLKKIQSPITIAQNGLQAIECYQKEEFDIVFMDIQMPVLDGLEATRRIRAWELEQMASSNRKRRVPIYALTAHAFHHEVQSFYDAGCDGHLGKPFRRNELMDLLFKAVDHNTTGKEELDSRP